MKLITILGCTATGKTKLAANLAAKIGGEIISADSRQVFEKMDIGTGKDYKDYIVNGKNITVHLIDILEAGDEFSVFDFQKKFIEAYDSITKKDCVPILCGGTGLYLESVLKKYMLVDVPENKKLRQELSKHSEKELAQILSGLRKLHNTTDTLNKERIIRAIEIEYFHKENLQINNIFPYFTSFVFGVKYERAIVMDRITKRLKERFESGMIQEVQSLINSGISTEKLKAYGLEYKYITQYLEKTIDYSEMFRLLNIAIHQFSKRQMTWFRRMEKNGTEINWIEGNLSDEEKVNLILEKINI